VKTAKIALDDITSYSQQRDSLNLDNVLQM